MNSSASPWRRLIAFALDYLVISAYLVVLVAFAFVIRLTPLAEPFGGLFANPLSAELSAFVLLVLPVVLYFALFEASERQGTWGKQRLGLKVTDAQGRRLTVPRSLARSLLKFIPWELTHACLWNIPGWPLSVVDIPPLIVVGLISVWVIVGIYIATLFLTNQHRSLYDLLAATYVASAAYASTGTK